jgi:murein DD-endopeptidase MepM/ murein hydrolase activator NlpD
MHPVPHLPVPSRSAFRRSVLPVAVLALLAVLGGALPGPAAARDRSPAPAGSAVWPLLPAPQVVAGFDPPATRWGAGHRGVDLAGSPGQPVRAALAGTVTFAGGLAGRGVVVVDHGGTRTTYEPVEASVDVGDRVAAGDRLGRLQSGGSHCAPRTCLHWGLLAGAAYLDPLTLVGAGPVRLLPLGGIATGPGVVPGAFAGAVALPTWARAAPSEERPRGDAALFRTD